jgi:predicted DNA-binding transcriptional regulator AlpA
MSLRDILIELGLKQPQVLKLRKDCAFPQPIGPARPMMFRRDEVERWVGARPDYNKLTSRSSRPVTDECSSRSVTLPNST